MKFLIKLLFICLLLTISVYTQERAPCISFTSSLSVYTQIADNGTITLIKCTKSINSNPTVEDYDSKALVQVDTTAEESVFNGSKPIIVNVERNTVRANYGLGWVDVGPGGPQGIQGIQGVAGSAGATGSVGAKGDKGDTGNTGAAGTNGTNGTNGAQGIQGIQGTAGATGATGATGSVAQFNASGSVTAFTKRWTGEVAPSTGNAYSIDISSAGFSTIGNVQIIGIKNTATVTSMPNVSIKTKSTSAIVVNITEGNTATVVILGINVLNGAPTIFANVSGLTLSVMVEGN